MKKEEEELSAEQKVDTCLETSDEWTFLGNDEQYFQEFTSNEEPLNAKNGTDSQSDIDVIDEVDDDTLDGSIDSSLRSSFSNLSFRRSTGSAPNISHHQYFNHDDISESSSLIYKEMDISPGIKAYKHTPNKTVNVKLNLFVAFAVTAVMFLGVGNYIGWSDNVKQNQLSMTQISKLKKLQDELVLCMQNQDKAENSNDDMKICYQNSDYWRSTFEDLFAKNSEIKDFFEKTQKQIWYNGHHKNIVEPTDCASAVASEEFHKLKLDLLVKQMEHLQLLKTFEEVKYQERKSKKRLTELEEENAELKVKLQAEEEDDKIIVETMEERISKLERENELLKKRLTTERLTEERVAIEGLEKVINDLSEENQELKSVLKQLQSQMQSSDTAHVVIDNVNSSDNELSDEDEAVGENPELSFKVDDLREQINQMVAENEDLKATIARLRWSNNYVENDELEDNGVDFNTLREELDEIRQRLMNEQEETKKWKQLYEEMKMNTQNDENTKEESVFDVWWKSLNFSQFKNDVPLGSTFNDMLNNVLQKATESNVVIPDEIYNIMNSTQSIAVDLYKQLVAKWEEVQNLGNSMDTNAQKIRRKMTELLETSVRKLQEAGDKFNTNQKPFEARINKLTNKMAKIKEWLDMKWNDIKGKYNNKRKGDDSVVDGNWYFERAKKESSIDDSDNWLFERARDREVQRVHVGEQSEENWYLRREKWKDSEENEYAKAKIKKTKY